MKQKKQNLVNYVKNSVNSLSEQKIGSFDVFFHDRFENDISFKEIVEKINRLLPYDFLSLIDVVYVGNFDFFEKRNINASYMNGAIYVSPKQDNFNDLLDDIVHEISHAVLERYEEYFYADGQVEDNFLSKRSKLQKILKYHDYDISEYDFSNTEYNDMFDQFLYKNIGYEKLNNMTIGLFLAPYSITSLDEYFARAFEEYYLGNRVYLRKLCPYVYDKLVSLEQEVT